MILNHMKQKIQILTRNLNSCDIDMKIRDMKLNVIWINR